MTKYIGLSIIIFTLILPLAGQNLGKIRFPLGDVQYRSNSNSPWKAAALNAEIEPNSVIKTGLDSSVEILWDTNLSSTVGPNKTVTMRNLYDETNQKQKWANQVKVKASTMNLKAKQRATTVAGIRREEVEIKSQSELYWDMEPLQNIDDAIILYESQKYPEAILKFRKVIEQGPLKKAAEIAHSFLILIYKDQANTTAMKAEITTLKADFPNSEILESIPQDL
ncbi:MAG: hypothetical protein CVU48_08185 [Candidatus Cloacimonetes bacterium HGW-Cloacimonetes-1]|jgi:hypothetical protein|nr:MAG: hypothetical protein CVU48_08185 [Candidatus Cloacimonetes bacterium HGW-Cloacimonetes-1]